MGKVFFREVGAIMGRPRKVNSEELVKIVDSYFESNGNPAEVRYSLIAKYAIRLGVNVKEYDFRRDENVKKRIEELKKKVYVKDVGIVVYKSMDIEAMICKNNTREKLVNSLIAINDSWKRIYDKIAEVTRSNSLLLTDVLSEKEKVKKLNDDKVLLEKEVGEAKTSINKLLDENRYLKRMIKKYLYPSLANELLKEDKVIDFYHTEINAEAIENMVDSNIPKNFSNLVSSDVEEMSRKESLLSVMKKNVLEEQ